MTGDSSEVPWKTDGATGLPWFSAIHADAAARAISQDLHVVHLRLGGLSGVMDAQGPAAVGTLLRQISTRASALLDHRDQLSRHTGDRLLVVTTRPRAEVVDLARAMAEEMSRASVSLDGLDVPQISLGIAGVPRAADYTQAVTHLDAAILSAEFNAGPHAYPRRAEHPAHAETGTPPRGRRAVLAGLRLDLSGHVATAVVDLTFGRRRTTARSVGRNAEGRRLLLIGEATARAVTELLPSGYGAVIHEVSLLQPGSAEQGRGVLSTVLFLSPEREQFLFGVAPAGDDPRMAAARAALSAVNRKIEPLLAASSV